MGGGARAPAPRVTRRPGGDPRVPQMTVPPPAIRPATDADVAAIVGIERASFGDPWSEGSFRSMLARGDVQALVAAGPKEVLGYAIAFRVEAEAELANLAVAPTARRAGVGGRLLDELLRILTGGGVTAVYLEVRAGNRAAIELYASRGFAPVGRRTKYYTGPVEDAVVMKRQGGG